ncbi:mCG147553 [Mus musculus]|nr:mCG147553 [Mus musculus]
MSRKKTVHQTCFSSSQLLASCPLCVPTSISLSYKPATKKTATKEIMGGRGY